MAPLGGQICNSCKWWPYLQLMQVAPSGGQICNLCKWRHLVAKYATNASGAMLLPNLIQVMESISGSVVPLAMFRRFRHLINETQNAQTCMHLTMLRLSFAYAIFTAPLVPAHFFDNTSDNSLRMTPFRVRFLKNIQTPPSPPHTHKHFSTKK